jgi:hypothetical protein
MKAKKISLVMLAMACIAAMAITSCSKSSGGSSGPTTIGGYVSSDSVASANLIAYWPLDGNGNDIKGGQTGTANGAVTYVTGVRGQAYQGDTTGTYISCAANSSLAALTSYSLSVWIKTPPAAKKPGQNNFALRAQGIFFMSSTPFAGELIVEDDNNNANQRATDSANIHAGFGQPTSSPYQYFPETIWGQDTATSGWEHLVMAYDGPSSTYQAYWNGNPVTITTSWGTGTSSVLYDNSPTGNPIGNLNFASPNTPNAIAIGAWPVQGLFGLNNTNSFAGNIDEIRIFNRALTPQEVSGLYLNGRAGR